MVALGSTYANQGLPRVVSECRRQAEPRRVPVVLGFVRWCSRFQGDGCSSQDLHLARLEFMSV